MRRKDSIEEGDSRPARRRRKRDGERIREPIGSEDRELPSVEGRTSTDGAGGVLSVVATPIGNLRDITIRALEVLKEADLIVCEDTRTSRILLQRWGITTELMSLHRFSESRKTQAVLERLADGKKVAIVSDAGVPAISDPGHRVVKAAREAGFQVTPIPGPSSISAALSVSGMDCSAFLYLGFAPKRSAQRAAFFQTILRDTRPCVFFDTPTRIVATLEAAAGVLGPRTIVLARELTKMHEEIIAGTAEDLLAVLRSRDAVKGEIVVVVEGGKETGPEVDLENAVKTLLEEGLTGKSLADEARSRFGLSKRDAYDKFLEIRRSVRHEEDR